MSEDSEVTISYLILCHDSPDRIVRLVTRILSDDETGQVVIHFDKNSSRAKFNELKARLHGTSRCHILENRVRCGWGQWSLVKATMWMLRFSYSNIISDYYYLLSEHCFPAKPLIQLKSFLYNSKNLSYIEVYDENWIKGGIREDRYFYRHIVNKKKYPLLHKKLYKLQKLFKFRRRKPNNIDVRFGSQWWCIHKKNITKIETFYSSYYDFFKHSYIPDEMFYNTFFYNAVCDLEYTSLSLTCNHFNGRGVPMVYNMHNLNEALTKLDTFVFFIRKVK
ncbi:MULTISPECIES: beta-1,6-N-acetylglucosaminyltransferase [unclassified Cobetia]|uniref:beta-1,6-N-acetylglucosaminyltransferase n=1 Tax=unclassified Cobetia TaxID=2609414 RepID=UPI00178CDC34|nr:MULTISPECIES: beta-1,6-N-acetylglucosaminyltransferase [unclassified Cobetia]MBE2169946.1 hypothetical protein [Cobetia sp. 2AS1]MDH2446948.1 beta-1,6-N-acetylglucosaminyltransferase [Cobetia sp. 2AS]